MEFPLYRDGERSPGVKEIMEDIDEEIRRLNDVLSKSRNYVNFKDEEAA